MLSPKCRKASLGGHNGQRIQRFRADPGKLVVMMGVDLRPASTSPVLAQQAGSSGPVSRGPPLVKVPERAPCDRHSYQAASGNTSSIERGTLHLAPFSPRAIETSSPFSGQATQSVWGPPAATHAGQPHQTAVPTTDRQARRTRARQKPAPRNPYPGSRRNRQFSRHASTFPRARERPYDYLELPL